MSLPQLWRRLSLPSPTPLFSSLWFPISIFSSLFAFLTSPFFATDTCLLLLCCRNLEFFPQAAVGTVTRIAKLVKHEWEFMPDYHNWTCHGEAMWGMNVRTNMSTITETSSNRIRESSMYREMIADVVGPNFNPNLSNYTYKEAPNPEAQKFYDILKSGDTLLYEGCT
ncbi:hypothetical protein M9H77_30425 [Catharanthus roseus]|uniref:Uncharacterized protein n=1 Tax=Catharanthus roseus TaxID=4058 RepID=A0ACB9ZZH8_CATRO|nr:hypothetical protein M9H77_30425 [Catharanthus roseus]